MNWMWWILSAGAATIVGAAIAWQFWLRRRVRERGLVQARKRFHHEREYLEAKFLEFAGGSGKPRGLNWESCDFEDDVSYARDRESGELAAFVGVTIRFSAIEGGPMEDVEAVSNLRAATAVFLFRSGRWTTEGRTIFNLNPNEAIHHFHTKLERVAEDPAART